MRTHGISATLCLLLTLTAAGCGSGAEAPAQSAATSTPVPTAEVAARPIYAVQRGTVEDVFTFTGRWQPRDQMMLSFPTDGRVRRVNVRRGDAVRAGDLLADYDVSALEDQLANAEIQLEAAQAGVDTSASGSEDNVENAQIALANARIALENARASSPWASVAAARAAVDSAQLALEEAERAYRDALSHPEQPASAVDAARQQYLAAQTQLAQAQANYFGAAQVYNSHQYTVEQAENAVVQAELNLQRAIDAAAEGVNDENVRSAQLTIDQLKADIADSSLYAPIDGVVLEVYIAPGDLVQAYDTVIVIGRPEPKEVVANLAIADANRLSVGMTGKCQVVNRPETAVGCIVRSIPLSSQDADQTTRVAAGLEGVAENQLIEVEIPLEVRENVLWLPPSVIRTFQNRTFVVLQTSDGLRTVDVELGLQTDDRVEIVSGVNEGDLVVAP